MISRSKIEKTFMSLVGLAVVATAGAYVDVQFLKKDTENLATRVQALENGVKDFKTLMCMTAISTSKSDEDKKAAQEICK